MSDKLKTDEPSFLHIFPQYDWHGDAFIVGTRTGLQKLRDAIEVAIANDCGVADGIYPNDGEGYWLCVIATTEEKMSEVPLSYTADFANDKTPFPKWIHTISSSAVQKLLAEKKSS